MVGETRTLSSRDRRFLVWRHYGPWGIVAAGCWIAALIVYLKQPAANREAPTECLVAAVAATAICVVYGTFKVYRAVKLFYDGVEVDGVVSSFGAFRMHRMITVNCSYEVNGKTYTTAWSGPADLYDLGDKVVLLVDAKRPAVCEQKANICREHKDPAVDDKPDSWKWWYYVLFGIGFGAATIACCLYPDFFKPRDDQRGAFAELCRLLGSVGIMGLFGVLSLAMFWIGFSNLRKRVL